MIILPANTLSTGGYEVDNSCRFETNTYLNLSISSAGNARTWTYSFWTKRTKLGAWMNTHNFGGTGNRDFFAFDGNDKIDCGHYDGGYEYNLVTNRKFRDTSAWLHIVLAVDTTQGTASNRVKLYVNGVQETSFSTETYPDQNHDTRGGQNIHMIGSDWDPSNYYFGYLAECAYVNGSQLAPTSFGEFDDDSPTIWKPKKVSGLTFGTSGFYLDFKDSANLGNDAGGGTDFTEVNLAATDQCTDTPTNSFCTMNPLDNYYAGNTYSEGNIKFQTKTSGGFAYGTPTVALSSGKWYVEFDCIASDDDPDYHQVGIKDVLADAATGGGANIGTASGESGDSWGYMSFNGTYRHDGYTSYGDSWAPGDIIGVYLDLDNNKLYFSKNGTIQNSGTGISITDPASTKHGYYYITAGGMSTNAYVTFEANFGNPFQSQSSSNADANGYGKFEYDPSSGTFDGSSKDFYAICSKNLAEFGG